MSTETPQEAVVNYVQEVLDELAGRLPDCETGLLELYALLALVRGGGTTLEDVHDAWSIWRNRTRPGHPSLIPFIKLAPEVRELDRKYAEAIREAAAELVRGGVPEPAPLPPGRYGRVEIPGYRENEGWISEETRFGLQVAVVRDREGNETAAVGVGPLCRVVWLPVPGTEAEPRLALTAGGSPWADEDDEDEPGGWPG